jgi:hypothetical protein
MPVGTGEGGAGRFDVALERTAAQTLAWYLGHRVTVTITALVFAAGVISASALAAATAPPPAPGPPATSTGNPATVTVTTAGSLQGGPAPTDGSITLTCTTDTQLTFAGTGSGTLTLTIDGAATGKATGAGRATLTVTGPPGTYTARFTATRRLDRMAWNTTTGGCST